jgi:hypothetical protein
VFGVHVLMRGGMRASVGRVRALRGGAILLTIVVATRQPIGCALAAQSVVPWSARSVVTSAVYATRMLGSALALAAVE